MPDEKCRFHTTGLSWAERAGLDGLRAVLVPEDRPRRNNFIHGIHTFGARRAFHFLAPNAFLMDFGCGSGRFTRFFAGLGCKVLGTEITKRMLERARRDCSGAKCSFVLTDGISIPVADGSLDAIWCCAVLRYSLFVPDPVYDKIAAEMFRVLRPGGIVANVEMYVDREPRVFLKDFESVGFTTRSVRVLQRYDGRLERFFGNCRWPQAWIPWMAQRCAQLRYHFDWPERAVTGLRDYLFVWEKPPANSRLYYHEKNKII